MVDLSGIVHW